MIRFLFPLILLAIWIYALADAIQVPEESMYRTGNKLIWVLVILLMPVIGAVMYFLLGRPVRDRSRPRRQIPPDDII